MPIPDAANKVPLMFRSQTEGRCQIQRVSTKDAARWVSEWIEKAYPDAPDFGSEVQTKSSTLTWRFVTNSGQDESVIRPVIGAKGWPFYPGSSMKGVFRRACTQEQADRYCGKPLPNGDCQPGILRFHGGYPTSDRWQENLVDIVHPQQNWQVKNYDKPSALVQISLYKPQLKFGISSIIPLEDSEWETIWNIWEAALSTGIGCRVSAGYGQPKKQFGKSFYTGRLQGQGQASKLLDGAEEFRPNMFKAAIRGHALRIFGGLTTAKQAESLVETLFGGVTGEGKVGLLSMKFRESELEMDQFGEGTRAQPTYEVTGDLTWLLTKELPEEQLKSLETLIKALTRFAMLLGGFGKSWRRADHRLFYPEYYEQRRPKPLIGCHWEWVGERSLLNDIPVRKLDAVAGFIDKVVDAASAWMQLQGVTPTPNTYADNWRESWHRDRVQVWGRLAENDGDCRAIEWLHKPYRQAIGNFPQGSIYCSSLTGQMGQIGRLWHRMYPLVRSVKDPETGKPIAKSTPQYLELLTIFSDDSEESMEFLEFLNNQQKMFQYLW